jgi:hypothetical protein
MRPFSFYAPKADDFVNVDFLRNHYRNKDVFMSKELNQSKITYQIGQLFLFDFKRN